MSGVPCPICGVEFQNENGVCGHVAGKTDEEHAGLAYQDAREMLAEGSDGGDTPTESSGESGGLEFPENPDAEKGPDGCCEAPEVEGGAGDYYRLDDGSIIELESGEQICVNCEEIHD